jgi:hypothetical protein
MRTEANRVPVTEDLLTCGSHTTGRADLTAPRARPPVAHPRM